MNTINLNIIYLLLGVTLIFTNFTLFTQNSRIDELQKQVNCLNHGMIYLKGEAFCYDKWGTKENSLAK